MVTYEYSVGGEVWWTVKQAVSVVDISSIHDLGAIRRATGANAIRSAVALGGKLKNGSLTIESICYLGFWR